MQAQASVGWRLTIHSSQARIGRRLVARLRLYSHPVAALLWVGLIQALGLMKRIVALLIFSIILTSADCSSGSSKHEPQAGISVDSTQTAVALDWLRSNKNESALATNRFGPTSAAIEFVEQLFAAGATQVLVVARFTEPERIAAEGGPYADELIVQLPKNPEQRSALFRIIAKETESEGFESPQDTGQATEALWWD